jgi:hypothetical protein
MKDQIPCGTYKFLNNVYDDLSIIMEFADNGDLYQKIATHQK